MDFDCKCMRILGTAAISIVGYQLVTKFLPWLYINIVGPQLFGPKVNVCRMGKWAGGYISLSPNTACAYSSCTLLCHVIIVDLYRKKIILISDKTQNECKNNFLIRLFIIYFKDKHFL